MCNCGAAAAVIVVCRCSDIRGFLGVRETSALSIAIEVVRFCGVLSTGFDLSAIWLVRAVGASASSAVCRVGAVGAAAGSALCRVGAVGAAAGSAVCRVGAVGAATICLEKAVDAEAFRIDGC